ncbi:EsaB/YukD family protein [Pseudobacteroides cellulosolvens]|uniref:YukD-like protein n=1 Tax=Pseudobacteroides cellulosolvens ATCC 35603 = DSM 2933 TaxID=398512 RepID=A0A0L6JP62_9FIRM|nr:EsaB/YukD family protein [Pseudobacteroides cellulosolvens]KNY27495.1 YukD-like protein [Pseudobacteroides cellulosolvens ATCC 35603 = DSM 2933]
MNSVIVTVKIKEKEYPFDLELPADIPAKELSNIINQSLNIDKNITSRFTGYQIYADPPGRIMKDTETLNDVGAWDGAILTLL